MCLLQVPNRTPQIQPKISSNREFSSGIDCKVIQKAFDFTSYIVAMFFFFLGSMVNT